MPLNTRNGFILAVKLGSQIQLRARQCTEHHLSLRQSRVFFFFPVFRGIQERCSGMRALFMIPLKTASLTIGAAPLYSFQPRW